MAFRFGLSEPVQKSLRRIGLEQIDRAQHELAASGNAELAIHETRKCLKRIRALLRLVKPGLSGTQFRTENERIREIAALLAPARDSQVLAETLTTLEGLPGHVKNASLAALKKILIEDDGNARGGPQETVGHALAKLETARRRFRRLTLAPNDFSTIERGLEQSYRRGRRAFRDAYAEESDEAFHEWRKTVQQHWRHMALISRAWPEHFQARVRAARALSQILGEDHDLAVLAAFAHSLPAKRLPRMHAREIERLAKARQKELRTMAAPRGRQLFVEGAAGHSLRVAELWAAAEKIGDREEGHTDTIAAAGMERQPAKVQT